jgi:PEP-CTERM motif
MRKRIIILMVALTVSLLPVMSIAIPITADFSGTRSVGSGVTASDGTKGADGWASKGFSISWEISQVSGGYDYTYTLDPSGQGAVSHFILEVSPVTTEDNFKLLEGDSTKFFGPEVYTEQSGNPGMPGNINGIKFDFGGDPATYHFFSTQAPVWGDFYSKDGAFGTAWNTGFGNDPVEGSSFTNWIATPDTYGAPVPEPSTLLLLGAGLLGLGAYGRRKMRS